MKNVMNTIINSIMRNVVKYFCAILFLIGTSAPAWGSVTYKVWDGSSYVNDGTVEIGGELKKSDGACDFTLGVEGWCTSTISGQVTRPEGVYKDGATCPSTTYLYLLYVSEGDAGSKYYSTEPNIYTITYSLSHVSKDEWTYTCASDLISYPKGAMVDKGNVYAYLTVDAEYGLSYSDFTFTYTSSGNSFTPSDRTFTDNGDGTYFLYIEGIDGDLTITATAQPLCTDIRSSVVSVTNLPATTYNCSSGEWEVTVSWSALTGATRYGVRLQYYNTSNSTWTWWGDTQYVNVGSPLSYTFSGLTAGTRYRAKVTASNTVCPNVGGGTNNNYTTTAGQSANDVTPACPAVTGLEVLADPITTNSALLMWPTLGDAGCDMLYDVTVTKHGEVTPIWSQTASADYYHELTGLSSNTRYDIQITATNVCGNSASITDYFTTEKDFVNYRYMCIDLDLVKTDGGGAIPVTSAAGQKIKAARTLTLTVSDATAGAIVNISAPDVLFYKSDGTLINASNLTCDGSGAMNEVISFAYNPTSYVNEDIVEPTISVSCDGNNLTFDNFIQARCLPDNFVIASKLGAHWYALTADCSSSGTYTGILIAVDDEGDPATATAPTETKWGMREVASGRYAANGTHMTFTEHRTATAEDSRKTLYNFADTHLGLSAAWSSYGSAEYPVRYEWIPTSSDLKDYTLTSATTLTGDANPRTISLKTDGVFGTLLNSKSYNGKVRLLPATFEDPAEMQVVEWKANSVMVMYTGSGVTATTQVGSNAESSTQTLTAKKKDRGVFELTTDQALTSNANELLTITIFNGSAGTVGSKIVTIPAIVSGEMDADDLVADVATAATTDVVVLDGATLSAVATKYTYNNITVYPGGKLVIGSGKQLGMASLNLRGGSSWGAATYQYKYPQFVVNNTESGAYSNSSATINYDYVTTKDQYYTFVLPYNGSTSTIKYPVDIYGSNVAANNKGSFEFQYYDGAARAGGGTGWATLAEPADLVAGKGYTFLGMPKKVDAYDGTDDSHATSRQNYGIHRIPMSVSATNVQNGETGSPSDKAIPISVTLTEKNNASGWVLVGNPYLSEVSGLSNSDIQVGQLVHVNDASGNWTGRWEWDNPSTGQRFLVIPGDDGQTYESVQASTAKLPAFKNFFAQISNSSATSMVIPATSRTDKLLAPRRFAEDVELDIQLAVDLVSETRSDKVDLLINDIYTSEFDLDGDFTKMMNGTKLNIYGVYPGDNLSFIAVDKTTAASSIAIGYQVPEGGDYTLQLSDKPYVMSEYIDALYVTDHEVEPNITTDLLDKPYVFHVNDAETNDTRFTLSIVVKKVIDTPTMVDVVNNGGDVNADKAQKFIWRDKMYIYYQGIIYDATGKRVKEINK